MHISEYKSYLEFCFKYISFNSSIVMIIQMQCSTKELIPSVISKVTITKINHML